MDVFGIEWKTNRANRVSKTVARLGRRFWRGWFSLGAIMSIVLMIAAVLLILFNLGHVIFQLVRYSLWSKTFEERVAAASHNNDMQQYNGTEFESSFVMTPLLPGINLPLNELGYLLLALALNAFVHEAGHAIAASCENVSSSF